MQKASELVAPLVEELEAAATALEKLGSEWWNPKSFKYRIVRGSCSYRLTCVAFRPDDIRERAKGLVDSARKIGNGCTGVGTPSRSQYRRWRERDLASQISTTRPAKPVIKTAEQFLIDQEPDNYKAYLGLWG